LIECTGAGNDQVCKSCVTWEFESLDFVWVRLMWEKRAVFAGAGGNQV
jgi:hypothetical protein